MRDDESKKTGIFFIFRYQYGPRSSWHVSTVKCYAPLDLVVLTKTSLFEI